MFYAFTLTLADKIWQNLSGLGKSCEHTVMKIGHSHGLLLLKANNGCNWDLTAYVIAINLRQPQF